MVTSDFSPEVEVRPFRACTMKNTQYNPYLWPNRYNFRVLWEIGVDEHDGDVRFWTGSGNTAVSRMRSEKYLIYPLFMAESPKFSILLGNRGMFRACAMHSAIIIGTVRSFWTTLWGRYHVPQNAFLVTN